MRDSSASVRPSLSSYTHPPLPLQRTRIPLYDLCVSLFRCAIARIEPFLACNRHFFRSLTSISITLLVVSEMALNPSFIASLDAAPDAASLAKYMVFNQEVREALEQRKPIVALESTGMLPSSPN